MRGGQRPPLKLTAPKREEGAGLLGPLVSLADDWSAPVGASRAQGERAQPQASALLRPPEPLGARGADS